MDLPCVWDAPRPYVHPLTTPAGAVLTVEAPADHPWHHALWFTIKFVNGENFWEEYGEFGTLRTIATNESTSVDGSIQEVVARLQWIAPDGETVRAVETRTIRTTPLAADAYAIDWTESLQFPVIEPVTDTVLDRTPFTTWGGYGGLTFRGAPDFTDTVIRLADGTDRDRALGDPSPWLSIEGTPHTWTDALPGAAEPQRSGGEQVGSIPTQHASTDTERTTRNDGGEQVGSIPTNHASTDTERTTRNDVRADRQAGVLVFDHPDNPRSPSPWYASTKADTYGDGWANFVNAAFLWDDPLTIAANESLELTYRVIVHDGHWDTDRIGAEYAQWIG
ncbi:MAG: DUF6807 family protein [Acidimicrobiia bacterium]